MDQNANSKKFNLITYVENLQDVMDVLASVVPDPVVTSDERILHAIREVVEVKSYLSKEIEKLQKEEGKEG